MPDQYPGGKIGGVPLFNVENVEYVEQSNAPKVYTQDAWAELITAMRSGKAIEITEAVFDYFLEVLPPIYMGVRRIVGDGADRRERRVSFGFAEGCEQVTAFWREGGRFYCQRTAEVNRG